MKAFIIVFFVFLIFIFSCDKNMETAAAPATGVAGSLSRFTIIGNYLYAVSSHNLYAIDISDPANPVQVGQTLFNYDMETIYPYKNRLFVGSKTGLYIYSIDTASAPRLIGEAKHGRSCDPVVANDTVSYSTLKSNTYCGPATSGLYVYNIKNMDEPMLEKTIPIDEPVGLAMVDSVLYVCCANEGMKVFSTKDPYDPVELKTISDSYFIDVICYNNILICWVSDGISLYDVSNRFQPIFIKKITD